MWCWIALILLLPGVAEAGKAQGAFWRSLLVPGWGQKYARGSGGGFLAAELALWGGYWGFEWLGQVRRDRYERMRPNARVRGPRARRTSILTTWGFMRAGCSTTNSPATETAQTPGSIR